jgi:hypothetical protein
MDYRRCCTYFDQRHSSVVGLEMCIDFFDTTNNNTFFNYSIKVRNIANERTLPSPHVVPSKAGCAAYETNLLPI